MQDLTLLDHRTMGMSGCLDAAGPLHNTYVMLPSATRPLHHTCLMLFLWCWTTYTTPAYCLHAAEPCDNAYVVLK